MNTRLQVEHPVTEEITGVDLVEWQLRVASGEELPLKQEELGINGHAIEARLYAEDPAKGFLPSTGRLDRFHLSTYRARIETGYEQGDAVSPFYDPMLAKIVVHAEDRAEAVEAMDTECATVVVWPVKTNSVFLARVFESAEFRAGGIDTGFLERRQNELMAMAGVDDKTVQIGASEVLRRVQFPGLPRKEARTKRLPRDLLGFRLNSAPRLAFPIAVDGVIALVEPDVAGHTAWTIDYLGDTGVLVSNDEGQLFHFDVPRTENAPGASAADGAILAPMPGKVIAVDVAEGDAVEAGQRLLVLEAMKMEHALTAPFAGTVAELAAREGQQVQVEALLARVEKAAD
jgi:3-methylcrotonyl-CoA carboxylase alpha subunit